MDKVTIVTKDGYRRVEAYAVGNQFAVTKDDRGEGLVVSHLPTGAAVARGGERDMRTLLSICDQLDEALPTFGLQEYEEHHERIGEICGQRATARGNQVKP